MDLGGADWLRHTVRDVLFEGREGQFRRFYRGSNYQLILEYSRNRAGNFLKVIKIQNRKKIRDACGGILEVAEETLQQTFLLYTKIKGSLWNCKTKGYLARVSAKISRIGNRKQAGSSSQVRWCHRMLASTQVDKESKERENVHTGEKLVKPLKGNGPRLRKHILSTV
ncbi:hypothetical protein TorRG33x02_145520 [Trema orientale]|uniref:Uncharacterized protein n=1 Tax=Trema orientale TaxID=63057 RepID=A0A2P5EW03_TREOI|nr:hypothetical protein TorRG33x02_145520 [Trema orientale]